MRQVRLNYNEIVRYTGEDCVYAGYTYLKTGDVVHIERQFTARKMVAFAMRWGGNQYTLKMPRELFDVLPNRPKMKSFQSDKERNTEFNYVVNRDVRYVLGQML